MAPHGVYGHAVKECLMIRSLDQEKCIGCGTCMKSCPLDVFRVHAVQNTASPCSAACPVHNDIRAYHAALQLGSVEEAVALSWKSNPLAAVTGRVCPHFCETKCSRNSVDSAVNIGGIERFLGDKALEAPVEPVRKKHVAPVAVVGSGPAGLTCAAELAREGFSVTVFEAQDEPGGMLRYGIPEYRLPAEVLTRLIEKLHSMGVSFRCGQRMGVDFQLDQLKEQGYRAVMLGLGAGVARSSDVEGSTGPHVMYGLEFLQAVRTRSIRSVSGRAMVVGGGDVAMDVAQSLARLGAESVLVASLESEADMPAFRHNIEDARSLGVQFRPSSSVRKIIRNSEGIAEIDMVRCASVFDEQGRFSPVMDKETTWTEKADLIVFAIGQACDLTGVPQAVLTRRGMAVDDVTGQTSIPWLFAAGDAVTGPSSVASAVGGGKRAAAGMLTYLRGGDMLLLKAWDMPVVPELESPEKHKSITREEGRLLPAASENGHFMELYAGLRHEQVLGESLRCLTCGSKAGIEHPDDCMTCFGCEMGCPTGAIYVDPIKEEWPRALSPIPESD